MKKILGLLLLTICLPAWGQTTNARVLSTCGTATYSGNTGQLQSATQDTNGNLCINTAGGPAAPVTATQGPAGNQTSPWWVRPTDGTNNMPMGDSTARPIFFRLTDGTSSFSFGQQTSALSLSMVPSTTALFPATQSGTWTVQPGNTANTTPWLFTINQGGNSAIVTPTGALKIDGSAVTQPTNGVPTTAIASTAVESGHILSATGPKALTNITISTTAAGLLMIFNSTTVPADGAVTPVECVFLAANQTFNHTYPVPLNFSTGISAAVSTGTNCASKTAQSTGWFTAQVQ